MLNRNALMEFAMKMTGAYQEFPFGPQAAVYKVRGKMFALIPIVEEPPSVSVKCDPVEAIMLREMYKAVIPGYHLSKKHWNTVYVDGEIPDDRILEMIEDSYLLVRQKLPKKDRQALADMENEN